MSERTGTLMVLVMGLALGVGFGISAVLIGGCTDCQQGVFTTGGGSAVRLAVTLAVAVGLLGLIVWGILR